MDWTSINRDVIDEFRANNGIVARFGGLPVVILHTIGARSGALIEVPLVLIEEGGEHLVFGSAAGSTRHPGWFYNLLAQPLIDVEYASGTRAVRLAHLPDETAAAQRAVQQARSEQFAAYVTSAAPRLIPVFAIRPLAD